MKVVKMKNKILALSLIVFLISLIDIKAQPYIYYCKFDTTNSNENIFRLNLTTNNIENFYSFQTNEDYGYLVWDPTQSYLMVGEFNIGYTIIDCADTIQNFEFEFWQELINEMDFSSVRNKLYLFSDDYKRMSVLDLQSETITDSLELGKKAYYNLLMKPDRSTFFSKDRSKVFLYNIDTANVEQVWTYSLTTNEIIQKRDLVNLSGNLGSDGYSLTYGRNGKGIIESYSLYNNPDQDFYYMLYDFDADTISTTFYHQGEAESYFNDNGEYLLIMATAEDTLNYYHTGNVNIYNTETTELVKSFTVPPGGTVYTFDNYPNNIYYVLNLDSAGTPDVYNLTQLKLHSISPSIALPYYARPIEPNVLTITVTGEFFTDSTVAWYNGNAKPTTFVSDSVVAFNLNSTEFPTVGDYPIWVSNYGSVSDTMYLSVVNSPSEPIIPTLQCVHFNPDKTITAFFGYNNQNDVPVGIVRSSNYNYFSPGNRYRGQPNMFLPGNHTNIFSVVFDGTNLTWTLVNSNVTANKYSTPCPGE